jgi:chemotaxis signal transduction protein
MSRIEHILFNAGGLALALPSSHVHAIHDGLSFQSVSGTVDWFLGMAVADGQLLPVSDLGSFFQQRASTGRIIEIARHFGIAGFRVDTIDGVSRNPGIAGSSVSDSRFLTDVKVSENNIDYQVVDIASLMQSARFLNIALEPAL